MGKKVFISGQNDSVSTIAMTIDEVIKNYFYSDRHHERQYTYECCLIKIARAS